MIKKLDHKNRFVSVFDPKTGFYARSGVLDESGKDTGVDPFMTAFPELIDVGVMGHCVHGSSGLCIKSGVRSSTLTPQRSSPAGKRSLALMPTFISICGRSEVRGL